MSFIATFCEDIIKMREVAKTTDDAELSKLLRERIEFLETAFKKSLIETKEKKQQQDAIASLDNVVSLLKPTPN